MRGPSEQPPLPPEAFDRALRAHLELIERRVRGLYVRSRALFAEALVAALVDGTVVEFPAAAWDLDMPAPGTGESIRIQVKCSGERTPQAPDTKRPASWGKLQAPKSARDPQFGVLTAGFNCDVFVFARHEGRDITRGWHFYLLPAATVRDAAMLNTRFDLACLQRLHALRCDPTNLKKCVAEVAGVG